MPLLIPYAIPLVVGGVGFVAGFFSNSAMSNLVKVGVVVGGVYVAYQHFEKGDA